MNNMDLSDILQFENNLNVAKQNYKDAKNMFITQHALYHKGEIVWSPYGKRAWISGIELVIDSDTDYTIKYLLSKVNKAGRKLKSKLSPIYYPENKLTKYEI